MHDTTKAALQVATSSSAIAARSALSLWRADVAIAAFAAAVAASYAVGATASVPFSASDAVFCAAYSATGTHEVDAATLSSFVMPDAELMNAGENILHRPLWSEASPEWFEADWASLLHRLTKRDEDWHVWTDWFSRRIAGSTTAFGLPRDADELVAARLLAQGKQFWSRRPAVVNAEISRWIADPFAEQAEPMLEQQNPLASIFVENEAGKIDVESQAGANEVRTTGEAIDRHAELFEALVGATEACRGNTGAALREKLLRYREALGERLESVSPSSLILRGEALRQERQLRRNLDPDSDLPPISDSALLALDNVVSAHNLFVTLDHALAQRDMALLDPATSHSQLAPIEAKAIIDRAAEGGILTEAALDTLNTAVQVAPISPDLGDRRSRLLSETVLNFLRKAFSVAWRHKKAIATTATAVPVGFYGLGSYLLANEATWLRWFAENPAMVAAIRDIMTFLRSLPLA